jgi:hypothetical protein
MNRSLAFKFGAQGLRFPDVISLQKEIYQRCSNGIDRKGVETAIQKHEKLCEDLAAKTSFTEPPDPEYLRYWKSRASEAVFPSR